MTAGSTLYHVRQWLFGLLEDALPGDVAFGWDLPTEPADTDGPVGLRRSVWLRADIEANAEIGERTMPDGWTERYTQVVRVQCLPEDGSVDVPSADLAATELLDVVIDQVEANKKPAITELAGWGVSVTYGGFRYQSGQLPKDDPRLYGGDGYAASYEIKIDVEASRCS